MKVAAGFLTLGMVFLASCAEKKPLVMPTTEEARKSVQHIYARDWVLTDSTDMVVELHLPKGWCVYPDATRQSVTFYKPDEESPTFFGVLYGKLYIPFDELCAKDAQRLTADKDGKMVKMSQLQAQKSGTVRVAQLETEGQGSHCLFGYYNYQDRYMVKFNLCNNEAPLSGKMVEAFSQIIKAMRVMQLPATSPGKGYDSIGCIGGGDGKGYEQAVTLGKSCGEYTCLASQYSWLGEHYPKYDFILQADDHLQGRHYSVIRFFYQGEEEQIYFDVTDCGK